MYKHILIATDGSDVSDKGVSQGLALAKALGARTTAVFVTEPWTALAPDEVGMGFPIEDYEKSASENAAAVLAKASAAATAAGVPCETVHAKDQFPAEGIIEAAANAGADLIVMASHGRKGLSRLFIGSQTNRVVIHSVIPVLVVR
jgi:nucleotide-binding universal stress UspA family protein